jgi:hypothetical protein
MKYKKPTESKPMDPNALKSFLQADTIVAAPGIEDLKEMPAPRIETPAESIVRALNGGALAADDSAKIVDELKASLQEAEAARDQAEHILTEANREAIKRRAAVDTLRGKLMQADYHDPAQANVDYLEAQKKERFDSHARSVAKQEAALRMGLLTEAECAKLQLGMSPIDAAIASRNIQNRRQGLR